MRKRSKPGKRKRYRLVIRKCNYLGKADRDKYKKHVTGEKMNKQTGEMQTDAAGMEQQGEIGADGRTVGSRRQSRQEESRRAGRLFSLLVLDFVNINNPAEDTGKQKSLG